MSALNYSQERLLKMKALMDSLQKQPEWTFATKKIGHGNCILLIKKKYTGDPYKAIAVDGRTVKFTTKTHAHIVAKEICQMGLENTIYELGKETYEDQ